jgi:TolB-like protein
MKRYFCVIVLFAVTAALFAQEKPRLAVVEFETNSSRQKVKEDAIAIRNLVRTNIVSSNKFEVITRDEIDKLIVNQGIQVSSIASPENIKKLQLTNISYIVTGTVDAMDNDYSVTISLLDVSNGRVSNQTSQFMSNASADINNKIPVLVSNFQRGITVQSDSNITYKVGDTGPAGGIIFYDRGFIADGWRYLEAAPSKAEFHSEWGIYEELDIIPGLGVGINISGTGTAIGSGRQNTHLIVERLSQLGENNRAAQIVVGMEINGYRDWFLPSKDELDLMYINLKQKELGSFSNNIYWSSSQALFPTPSGTAFVTWCQRFMNAGNGWEAGAQTEFIRSFKLAVRAIRAF